MSTLHLSISSFNAGELSPLLDSRQEVEKVANGCRKLRNFFLHSHGPAFRRPGMERMGASASQSAKSRLLPFVFSNTTSFMIEISSAGLKVWSSSGAAVTLDAAVSLPYLDSECFEVQSYQVNDVVYLTHANHPEAILKRVTDTDWRYESIEWIWPPMGDENITSTTLQVVTDNYTDTLGNIYTSPTDQQPFNPPD